METAEAAQWSEQNSLIYTFSPFHSPIHPLTHSPINTDPVMSLIILSGRPGVGKTTIARGLARHLGAVHVRIDPIEQAIRESRMGTAPIDDAGYRVGYAVAEDNLRLGRTVIADSVNP